MRGRRRAFREERDGSSRTGRPSVLIQHEDKDSLMHNDRYIDDDMLGVCCLGRLS